MKKEKSYLVLKLVFSGLWLLAVLIRIYQLVAIYDYSTGSFTNHNNPTVYIFYGLIVLSTAGLLLNEKIYADLNTFYKKKTNVLTGIGQLVLGFVALINCGSGFTKMSDALSSMQGAGAQAITQKVGGVVFILIPIFALLSGIVLIIHAIASFSGKHFEKKISILNLAPVFWALCNVIACFTETASYLKKSEVFVEVFTYMFAMIAFLGYARFLTGIGTKDSGNYLRPMAVSCTFMSFMAVLEGLFCSLNGTGSLSDSVVFCGLFIFFALLNFSFLKKDKNPEITEPEKAE